MSIELIIIPLLAMTSGIISLFVDPKNPKNKWVKSLLLTILMSSTFATILISHNNQSASKEKALKFNQDIRALSDENKALKQEIINTPQKTVDLLLSYGYTPQKASSATSENIVQSKEANLQLKSNSQSVTEDRSLERSSITVEYFPKDIDPEVVQSTLEKLGFKIKISKPKVSNISTNAIWFGSKVNINDIKLVAYTLVRAGIKIKTIKPFRGDSEPFLIQVGADGDYENRSGLGVVEIRNAKGFIRE